MMIRSIQRLGIFALSVGLANCGNPADEMNLDVTIEDPVAASSPCVEARRDPTYPLQAACAELAAVLQFPDTVFAEGISVATGELTLGGAAVDAHCLLTGKMHERVSPVDGMPYAVGFEMRLPLNWNGRFFYQGNGGLDGEVATALGAVSGGGPLTSALQKGFVVISSDAGHSALQNPIFGLDPQARLDYGYQAVGKLTPMAKSVIRDAYGMAPRYSYIGGCSNGGRHAMVAASRYPEAFDGFLVGAPGFRLPEAALANIYGAQQYALLAEPGATIPGGPFAGLPDLSGAFTMAEQQLLSESVLEKCDALDGLEDGMVQAAVACQRYFNLEQDVPTCPGERDGTCLSAAQKVMIENIFAGPRDNLGEPIYAGFPFDAGHAAFGTGFWEFIAPLILDASSVGFVFSTPPADPATFIPPLFALTGDINQMASSIFATNDIYTESAMSFMVPPDLHEMRGLRRGKRMIVYHGVSDPIFSAEDTVNWYESLPRSKQNAVRLFLVPGMNHCAEGPATDQFDLLTPLMQWVERGTPPKRVIASARGPENPGGADFDLPVDWAPNRTRPLCPFPEIARYTGGDIESAESFVCKKPHCY